MTTTLIRTLHLEDDLVEVHYNPHLKNNPYLVRIFSYNSSDPVELRLEKKEVDNLYQVLKEKNLL
jgi:hypothetical protein